MKKRIFTFLLALAASAGTVFADDFYEWDFNDSGKCGPNLKWEYTIWDDRLVISGTGDMYNWDKKSDVPWYKHSVKVVEIGENVTSIGTHAFDSSTKLRIVHWNAKNCPSAPFDSKIHKIHTVKFGDKVEVIPDNLFYGMDVSEVNIPDNVKTIGNNAFRYSGVFNLTIGDGVTHIGKGAFSNCSDLNSVSIGAGVTYIGDGAFDGCTKIQGIDWHAKNCPVAPFADAVFVININFYSTVEVIPANLCAGKSKLTQIIIPNSVKTIGSNAFKDCIHVFTLQIGTGVTSIGAHAFENCPITDLHLPDGLQTIGSYAFAGCRSVTGSISIPGSVTSVGEGAFYQCSGLSSVGIGSGVTSIAAKTFQGCSSCASITIPSKVTSIGASAFQACTSLANAYLPANLTSIGDSAFSLCSSLAKISIPDKVTTFGKGVLNGCHLSNPVYNAHFFIYLPRMVTGNYAIKEGIETIVDRAFQGCSGLTSVTIPSSVKAIRTAAFSGCNHLNSITCEATTPPACAPEEILLNSVWLAVICPVYVPIGCVATYKNITSGSAAEAWRHFEDFRAISSGSGIIPSSNLTWSLKDSVLTISGTGAMTNWSKAEDVPWYDGRLAIKSVVIDKGVTSIADNAFYGCSNLSYFNVANDNSVFSTSLGTLYNKNYTQLVQCAPAKGTYTFTSTVTSVRPSAFNGCKAPFSITCESATPPALTSGNTLFANVTGTMDVYVPEADISTYQSAWGTTNCQYRGLQNGTCIVNGIKYEYHSDGTATVLANTTKYSGDIAIPATFTYGGKTYTVTATGLDAFKQCTGLTSISLPNTMERIGISFSGCTALKSVTIPENVSEVSYAAFMNCTGLQVIYFNSEHAVPSTGAKYFLNLPSDLLIYVPAILLDEYRARWSDMTNIQSAPYLYYGLYYKLNMKNYTASVIQHPDGGEAYNPLENIEIPRNIQAYGQSLSVDTIAKSAFYYADEITSVTIPNNIEYIDEYAFFHCDALTTLELPKSVKYIGSYAFEYCSGLTSITCYAKNPPTCGDYFTFGGVTKSIPLYVPYGTKAAYQAAEGWKDFTNIQELAQPVTTCAGVNKAADGDNVDMASVSVVYTNNRYVYVQDETGITLVYLTRNNPSIQPGIRLLGISGEVDVYNGLPEVKPSNQSEWLLEDGGDDPNVEMLNDVPTAAMVNALVYIPRATAEGTFTPSSTATINVTLQNGKTVILKNQFRQEQTFTTGKAYDILAAVAIYNETVQLYFINVVATFDLYNIRFLNDDGTVLQESNVASGFLPIYKGETPEKAATEQYTYTFTGWNNPVDIATENKDYMAVYEQNIRLYDISLLVNDETMGFVFGAGCYEYGATARLLAYPEEGYHFVKWSDGQTQNPREVTVTEDVTYTAIFEADAPTAIESVQPSAAGRQKVLRNGVLYIEKDGKTYTVTGQEVK